MESVASPDNTTGDRIQYLTTAFGALDPLLARRAGSTASTTGCTAPPPLRQERNLGVLEEQQVTLEPIAAGKTTCATRPAPPCESLKPHR